MVAVATSVGVGVGAVAIGEMCAIRSGIFLISVSLNTNTIPLKLSRRLRWGCIAISYSALAEKGEALGFSAK